MQTASRRDGQKRGYRLGRRAEKAEATRRRITQAAFELHATVGPAQTSVSAIAAQAGVQRRTVSAHFPDLGELYLACTVYGMEATGMPEPAAWLAEPDAVNRLARGLQELYGWYASNERMLANVLAGEPPIGGSREHVDPFTARLRDAVDVLRDGWVPGAASARLLALLTHVVAFETWRSLAAAGLGRDEAVGLMTDVVAREARRATAAGGSSSRD